MAHTSAINPTDLSSFGNPAPDSTYIPRRPQSNPFQSASSGDADIELGTAVPMPSPRGKNALQFKGKGIDEFLAEYEHNAEMAQLTSEKKCRDVKLYFGKKEKRVLEVLAGYRTRNWSQLKEELRSLYTSSYEKRAYQPKDMQRFVGKD